MPVTIKTTAGYLYLDSWVMANIIQLSTQRFCLRFLNRNNDPCGRQYDQMTQAARSVTANIAEGAARHQTSRETEMKLTDVARASLHELAGDYLNCLMSQGLTAWPLGNPQAQTMRAMRLDAPNYGPDLLHDASAHVLAQQQRFAGWTDSADLETAANAILILCGRLSSILRKQMAHLLEEFKVQGGFTENLTAERLTTIKEKAASEEAPRCPLCGGFMVKRMAKKGRNQGREFWSCADYPRCNGTWAV